MKLAGMSIPLYPAMGWAAFNTFLGLLIGFLRMEHRGDYSTPEVFFISQLVVHFAATSTVVAGYQIGERLLGRSPEPTFARLLAILIPVTILAGLLGELPAFAVVRLVLGRLPFTGLASYLLTFAVPTVLMILIVTPVCTYFEYNRRRQEPGESAPGRESADAHRPAAAGISCRVDHSHYFVKFEEILYVSSHGRNCVLHTIQGEYRVARLLKTIEERLPPNFLRIHKSYIIRTDVLSHIQYMAGGAYLAFLNDSEKTTLPVGRSYAASLKTMMGMS